MKTRARVPLWFCTALRLGPPRHPFCWHFSGSCTPLQRALFYPTFPGPEGSCQISSLLLTALPPNSPSPSDCPHLLPWQLPPWVLPTTPYYPGLLVLLDHLPSLFKCKHSWTFLNACVNLVYLVFFKAFQMPNHESSPLYQLLIAATRIYHKLSLSEPPNLLWFYRWEVWPRSRQTKIKVLASRISFWRF